MIDYSRNYFLNEYDILNLARRFIGDGRYEFKIDENMNYVLDDETLTEEQRSLESYVRQYCEENLIPCEPMGPYFEEGGMRLMYKFLKERYENGSLNPALVEEESQDS